MDDEKIKHEKGYYLYVDEEHMGQYLIKYDFYFYHKDNKKLLIAHGSSSSSQPNEILKNNFTWFIKEKHYNLSQILELHPDLENKTIEELVEVRTNLTKADLELWSMYNI